MDTYWKKQDKERPLYPELLWDKPDNKRLAGKLLIIGGNSHEFSAPAQAFKISQDNGVGDVKVLLPNALKKTVGKIIDNGEYGPSTKSGSFSKQALDTWLEWTNWADGILIAGDIGRNSETSILLEKYISTTNKPLILTKDSIDYFKANAKQLLARPNTLIVLSIAQLQKLSIEAGWTSPVTFSMSTIQLVEFLHSLSQTYACSIITLHNENIFVAYGGLVSTTKRAIKGSWRVEMAAKSSVWLIQNKNRVFEALTMSVS
jgi:ADP-dependent NAD(P)H-hydrate dehydratase / NAD(P)H-hydrate epimerase